MSKLRTKGYKRSLMVLIILTIALVFIHISNSDKTEEIIADNTVNAKVDEGVKVIPCGFPVGIYLETNGVMVISSGKVQGEDGIVYEPALDAVKSGDYIVSVNGIDVSSKSQLLFLVNKYGSRELNMVVRRNNEELEVNIIPVKSSDGEYKIGVWVRDDTQGIGTMTFVTNKGEFGALGHGISDIDTGELLASNEGYLYNARIWGINKGSNGTPGGLCGTISYDENNIIGEINKNTSIGIFGDMDSEYVIEKYELSYVEVGGTKDVKEGRAYIRSMVSGKIEDYEIEITHVDRNKESNNRQLKICVTDERLLKITNGIVQGMSGSPIIQDGKLIGAVTHVLVDDPTMGYGILIEEMLEKRN